MNNSQGKQRFAVYLGCAGVLLFCVASLVGGSWLLDRFDNATRGTVVESVLNFIARFWYWVAVIVVAVSIIVGVVQRRRE
jgi:hypothetical protein